MFFSIIVSYITKNITLVVSVLEWKINISPCQSGNEHIKVYNALNQYNVNFYDILRIVTNLEMYVHVTTTNRYLFITESNKSKETCKIKWIKSTIRLLYSMKRKHRKWRRDGCSAEFMTGRWITRLADKYTTSALSTSIHI